MASASYSSAIKWNFVGSVARIIATVLVQVILLRLLGPTIAGQFAIFLVIVGIGSILSEGGMMIAIARAPAVDKDVLANAVFLIFCYATGISVIIYLAIPLILQTFQLPPSERNLPLLAILNVLPLGLVSVPFSLLKRQYRAGTVQTIQVGSYLAGNLLIGVPLALFWKSSNALIAAFTAQTFISLIAAWIVGRCPVVPRIRGAREIRNTSIKGLAINVVYFINESAPNVMTARLLGTHAVGLYGTAANLLRSPTDVIVTMLHAPLMVATARVEERAKARDHYLSAMNAIATLVVPAFFAVFMCAERLVVPLLGPKWIDASPVLSVIGLVMIARLTSMISGAVIWGNGRLSFDLAAQTMAVITFLTLCFTAHPQSPRAIAWMVLAALALRMAFQTGVAMRGFGISAAEMGRAFVMPALLSAAAMLPLYWIDRHVLGPIDLGQSIVLGLCGGLLLAARAAVGLWRSPFDWAQAIVTRLPRPLHRRLSAVAGSVQ